jgi:hypothetical protein
MSGTATQDTVTYDLDEDYLNCEQCIESTSFYKRGCTSCDGTSNYTPMKKEALP